MDTNPVWTYAEAFSRNRGLISAAEQRRLRECRVAIIGMGGVGGVHLATLARLGIGRFSIADPDRFGVVNFNRQYGASTATVDRPKADVMAEVARSINPEVELRAYRDPISPENVGAFLDGADLLIDGVDFFNIAVRRLVFREAQRRGLWGITAGPLGFSTAWLSFDPRGMTFDRYFDLRDDMERLDQLVAFAAGLTPRFTHRGYFDMSQVDIASGAGPSVGLACQLASGVAAAETVKILLGRGPLRPAPCYAQFDAYRGVLRRGRLPFGNRSPIQRLKRRIIRSQMLRLGYRPE